MNRRDRRMQRRRIRRAGVVLASMVALGATAGLGGTAFAGRANGGNNYGLGTGTGGNEVYNQGQGGYYCNGFWVGYSYTHDPGHGNCNQG